MLANDDLRSGYAGCNFLSIIASSLFVEVDSCPLVAGSADLNLVKPVNDAGKCMNVRHDVRKLFCP
jgi:hypothetical protein